MRFYLWILVFYMPLAGLGQAVVTSSDSPYCEAVGILLNVTPAASGTNYQWWRDKVIINGETSSGIVAGFAGYNTVKMNW